MSGYENFRFVVQILFSTLQEKKLCDRLFDTFHTIVVVESSTYLTSKVATISALYFVIFHFSCSGNLSGRLSRWLQLIFPLAVSEKYQQSNRTKITSYMYKVEKSVLTTIFTLAKINLLYMKNAGTQWTMVSYFKK